MDRTWAANQTRRERRRARMQARRRTQRRVAVVLGGVVAIAAVSAAALRYVPTLTAAGDTGGVSSRTASGRDAELASAQGRGDAVTPAAGELAASSVSTAPSADPAYTDPVPSAGYQSSVRPVSADELGASWHDGCPVGPDALRAVTVRHFDFDGTERDGTLIVHADVAETIAQAFAQLYDARFPIRSIIPVAEFAGSDDASMDADNTSAFNCRAAVADGPTQWSQHAYGMAIDINPRENPYLFQDRAWPLDGAAYADRSDVRDGMATAEGVLVAVFAQLGWGWGGAWGAPDFQHFSATGH